MSGVRRWLIWLLLTRDQREELIRLRDATAGSHYVDLVVRRNGENRAHEADYVRRLAHELVGRQR